MERKTAHDFDQDLLILFDAYVHGVIDRRAFLEQASKYAVGGVTAAMLLDQLSPKFAEAQVVPTDDARIAAEYVEYDSPNGYGKMRGYLVRPEKATGKLPAILVIHENRGLNPHIEDVARRFALENFVAFAPDALFPLGGYPGDEDKARELFPKLDQAEDARGLRRRGRLSEGASGEHGQGRRGGLLLRRRHGELPRHAPAAISPRGVAFYGSAPNVDGRPEDQGSADDPVGRGG